MGWERAPFRIDLRNGSEIYPLRLLAFVVLSPLFLIAALIARLFFNKPAALSAEEVTIALTNWRDGTGGPWDIDDFTSVPIADPELDEIRQEAAMIAPPEVDGAKLDELIARAEAIMAGRRG